MIIKNAEKYDQCFGEEHLYIFTISHEHRSFFLYNKLRLMFPSNTPVVFTLDDYNSYPDTAAQIEQLKNDNIPFYEERYDGSDEVHNIIVDRIQQFIERHDSATIHIDYSSMPRSWYCKLPLILENIIRDTDTVFFWYTEGEYPASHEAYPSAGIESFSFFSGKPSLQIENPRMHVIALGYDVIRTQAILSITDPSYLVSCYAYNPKRRDFLDNIRQVNKPILARSAMSIALHIDDFEYMVSKLCDIANELLPAGDVVLIPDGPKPLIFALSLVPDIVGKLGLTCLHIIRNTEHFELVDVFPTESILGFKIKKTPQS